MTKQEISILLGLILSLVLAFFTQANFTAYNIRQETLRLHIIANSNLETDQDIKLLVRDEVLVLANELFSFSNDINEAILKANESIPYIESEINSFLEEKGVKYLADVKIEDFYFDTTSYNDFTLPKGEYPALTIRLGEATGNNWWCVMYPSVCISSSCEYEDEEINDFINDDDIKIKFKAVEIFEDVKNFILNEEKEVYDKI